MKTYICHKKVQAFKITEINASCQRCSIFIRGDGEEEIASVSRIFLAKHNPQVGGYYVRYADGYESYSPAAAFEAGYTEVTTAPEPPAGLCSSVETICLP